MHSKKKMSSKKTQKKNKRRLHILILGGGLTGLSAANKLLDKGFSITIFDSANFLGGLASSFTVGKEQIPRFNHHIVKSNNTTLKYLQKYKLLGMNKWQRINMGFGIDGKISNINNPRGLLGFKYLSLWGKFRLGLFGLYTIFLLNPEKIDNKLDLNTWLDKYAGREVKEKIWKNLYGRNKFNLPLKQISAKQFAHRLHEKEGYDLFTYPQKGLQGMIDYLEKDIKRKGGKIFYPVTIEKIDLNTKRLKCINHTCSNKIMIIDYDIIINTMPLPEFLQIAKGLPRKYLKNIRKLRYVPVIGLAFATKEFLNTKMYWINLFNERIHVIYQHSLIFDKYNSKISWCVRYGNSEEDLLKSDEEIKSLYIPVLKKYFPNMELKWCKVFRERYAEPIYDKNYQKYAPTYETQINGLYHAGIQVTFPKIRNMNVALESGEKVADIIINQHNP